MARGSVVAAEGRSTHDINALRVRDGHSAHVKPLLHDNAHTSHDSSAEQMPNDYFPVSDHVDLGNDAIELLPLAGSTDSRVQHRWQSSHAHSQPDRDDHARPRVSALWIAVALSLTVLGFAINTEATAYFEDTLKWRKPFATMYITHSSLILPWICHTAWLRWRSRHVPFPRWSRDYIDGLQASISRIGAFPRPQVGSRKGNSGAIAFLLRKTALITAVLTVSGATWFFALGLTTPSDLTAIYNCSTFFAAVFSVPLLREKLGGWSIVAVLLSLVGTFAIAYGDSISTSASSDAIAAVRDNASATDASTIGSNRVLGNLLSILGALAFGLYEVLLKKWACPDPRSPIHGEEKSATDPGETLPLTLATSALTGFYTFIFLWVALLALHLLGLEVFEVPTLQTTMWIIIAVLSGSFSLTLLVVLVVWTDPIFGSMANVLAVFAVALADWWVWDIAPSVATYVGGSVIVLAFVLLAKDSLASKHQQ